MRSQLLIFSFFVFLSSSSFCDGVKDKYIGAWQPSYAFNGKIPWFNGVMLIQEDFVIFETEGKELEKWKVYSAKQKTTFSNGVQSELYGLQVKMDQDHRLFVFEINQRYGCKPKSVLKKDESCSQRDSQERFLLRVCKNHENSMEAVANCRVRERYYAFDEKSLVKLRDMSENM